MNFLPETLPNALWRDGWNQEEWDCFRRRLRLEAAVLTAMLIVRALL